MIDHWHLPCDHKHQSELCKPVWDPINSGLNLYPLRPTPRFDSMRIDAKEQLFVLRPPAGPFTGTIRNKT